MKTLLTYRTLIVALAALIFALTFHGVSDALTYSHIYVDAVNGINAPTGRGSATNPYKSITFALLISERNNLPDPWHVHIHPGNYNGDAAKGNAREIFPLKLRQEMIFEGTTTAEECIIDGRHTGAATVPILHGEDTEGVTIRNLTIQNSLRTDGVGGIVLNDPTGTRETPSTLEKCVVHNNKGGGVWSNMPLIFNGNTFSNNDGHGVSTTKSTDATKNTFAANKDGIHIQGDVTGEFSENTFQDNIATGLFVSGRLEGVVTRNVFTENYTGVGVGSFIGDVIYNTFAENLSSGFRSNSFNGNLTHNTFTGNGTRGFKGFQVLFFTGNITHNEFTDNIAGGFEIERSLTGDVIHNRFTRNERYGGFSIGSIAGKVTHNIFDSNWANQNGGGFYLGGSTNTVEVFNNIFFNNTSRGAGNSVFTGHATHFINNLFMISDELSEGVSAAHTIWVSSPNCQFHNNIFSGVKTAIYTNGTFDLPITHNLFHNIRVDFVDQAGNNLGNDLLFWELVAVNATDNLEGDPQLVDPVTTRDFHLQSTSPAIDAGTNAFAPADDFDGVIRPVGTTVDIGPYEYGGTPVVGTEDPTGPDEPDTVVSDPTPDEPDTVVSDPTPDEPVIVVSGPLFPIVSEVYPAWDVNEDGKTDITDLVAVAAALGTSDPENPRLDVNGDDTVNIQDLILVATHLGETTEAAAPVIVELPKHFTPETLQQMLELLWTQNDGSVAFKHAIANVEPLLASITPKETLLLANYPNPFNPETWMPYQLASPADVTLHIHAVDGSLVRMLSLGHKDIGMYQSRSRAAYWDGKNEFGEPVASGIYFYTLTAGDFTATRKMLIRK
ncbi:right-handed parallel beta-helix repeat-containing protein [Candidatus Poribacteria bacterium]|nr:right-handed parallel beta-helix repeat-containing protein [Candidatus Poribacteria bacterium]